MKIHRTLDDLPSFRFPVLTIGAFDGVHLGHRRILATVNEIKEAVKGESILLTFDPHPRKIVYPNDDSLRLITTLDEKIKLIEECGIDHLIIIPFTIEFSRINPFAYVDKVLIEKIGAKHLIIGYDHRFGLNREGNIDLLRQYEENGDFIIHEIPQQEIRDLKISSTRIRNYLGDGNIALANQLLGAPFRISGSVVKGEGMGAPMGYPTANIKILEKDKLLPRPGSYAAKCLLDGHEYEGMLYIGRSTTLKSGEVLTVEMNIFHEFQEPLYGKELTVEIFEFIREDENFSSRKELMTHITLDKSEVVAYFNKEKNKDGAKVTIAILNYNGKDLLERFLPSIQLSSKDNFEVLIIDNHSTDSSKEWLAAQYPDLDILALQENKGFAGGYNRALSEIKTPYVAIVNSDVEFTAGWLDPLITELDENFSVAMVQPKILSASRKNTFEYAGAAGGFIDIFGYPFCRGRLFETLEKDNGQYDNPIDVFWASGAAMIVRTDIYNAIGGFDEDFFAHQEEIDLAWRIRHLGFRIRCIPESVVYHVGGATLSYDHPKKTFLNIRNNWWTILKNERPFNLIYLLPIRISLDMVFSIKLLFNGKLTASGEVVRGLIRGIASIGKIREKRLIFSYIRSRLTVGNSSGDTRFRKLLPWTYYIRRKKKYSDIVS